MSRIEIDKIIKNALSNLEPEDFNLLEFLSEGDKTFFDIKFANPPVSDDPDKLIQNGLLTRYIDTKADNRSHWELTRLGRDILLKLKELTLR